MTPIYLSILRFQHSPPHFSCFCKCCFLSLENSFPCLSRPGKLANKFAHQHLGWNPAKHPGRIRHGSGLCFHCWHAPSWQELGRAMPWCFLFKTIFYFFKSFWFIRISWRLITLQYCSGFCHTLTWISHGFTCVPHPDPSSHLPPHHIPLGHPSAPALSTCLMHPTWTGDMFHTW